jgi:uridine kinase
VAISYIAAPAVLVSVFAFGSTDLIPMAFLITGFFAMDRDKPVLAGLLFGLAIGSKIILIVIIVGLLLFYSRSPKLKLALKPFLLSLGLALITSSTPLVYSKGFRASLSSSDDATGPLGWGLPSPNGDFLILPLLVFVTWFAIYQVRRMNGSLLALAVGIPLLLVASLPGATVGWSTWSLPFLVLLAASLPIRFRTLTLLATNLSAISFFFVPAFQFFGTDSQETLVSLTATVVFAVSGVTSMLLWREHYTRSDFIRLRSRPALVLIAGDSGVGKDTLSDGLTRVLGPHSCFQLSGDDYHRWDRGTGSWKFLTHLDPSANELPRFFDDILSLSDGADIRSSHYDHSFGRRLSSQRVKSKEFVIASGLHALLVRDINKLANLTVFLEMDDELRMHLKIRRDTVSRGHSPQHVIQSISDRESDSRAHITPQRDVADLIVRSGFLGVQPPLLASNFETAITIESEPKLFDHRLLNELSVTCGLEVSTTSAPNNRREIRIKGSASREDLTLAFYRLEPRVASILGGAKEWDHGPTGVIQMIVMVYLANSLRRERLVK